MCNQVVHEDKIGQTACEENKGASCYPKQGITALLFKVFFM
jgi:hypothetical protein